MFPSGLLDLLALLYLYIYVFIFLRFLIVAFLAILSHLKTETNKGVDPFKFTIFGFKKKKKIIKLSQLLVILKHIFVL